MHARIASEPAFRTRFRLEADAARVIGGQYGAQVMAADPLAETPWLATEYVLGPPLDDAVELAGPFPEPSVRALGAALCTALGQLHRSDVVHRDLKPSNIMVTAYGPKVIDFGIARAIGDDRLTHTGAAVGTPAFMSPEQATGQEHTPAGDVFALAGVLVFTATGAAPFGHGQPADLLYRVRYGEPDLSRVPTALVPILAPCLAKDPVQRPTTAQLAAQFHDGNGAFADHLPDVVLAEIGRRASEVWGIAPQRLAPPEGEPPAPAEPAPKAAGLSRRRMLMLGGGLTIGAVAAGAGVWEWRERGAQGKGPGTGGTVHKDRDTVWMSQLGTSKDDPLPTIPIALKNAVLIAQGNVAALDPKTGQVIWQSEKRGYSWQTAVDGDIIYQLVSIEEMNTDDKNPSPVAITTLDASNGKKHKPFARFTDLNGELFQTQLLGVADGVLFLVAGRGKDSVLGFLAGQDWFIQAVDTKSGKRLWSKPLPPRRNGEQYAYVLTSRIVGHYLVTLQETGKDSVRGVVRDTRTGDVRWEKSLDMDLATIPLAADETHFYVGNKELRALRLSDGEQEWAVPAGKSDNSFGPPSLMDGVVYAVEDGVGLVAVGAAGGERLWAEKGGDGNNADLNHPPVIGRTYAYYKSGVDLLAVSLSSHTAAFRYSSPGDRFFVDGQRTAILAMSDDTVSGMPLQ